jgi:formylglycine-generating enzyme required for sulfatase activity
VTLTTLLVFACAAGPIVSEPVVSRQAPKAPDATPPGLVLVPGGRTRVGIEVSELKKLLEADPRSQEYAGALSAETPQHVVEVDDAFLMLTEVTNEQYAAFLRATERRPPYAWAAAAIARGREAYLQDLDRAKAEALAAGRPVPDPVPFDAQEWWSSSWRGQEFAVPSGDELRPVVYVDWNDARDYARWAGLRLPTEFEYQRAVRGDTNRSYPWGDEWDSERFAATSLLKKRGGSFPVGSFPAGASKQGVLDLAGNVWEWTASRYVAYPGYELRQFEFGFGAKMRRVDAIADWNERQRVVVGGSFQNGNLMARASTRRATEVRQTSDALGFRCAANVRPGADLASALLEDELTPNARPYEDSQPIAFVPEATVAAQRWEHVASTKDGAPQGYAVITREHHVLFTPVKQVAATDIVGFERATLEKLATTGTLLTLGFFSTNERVVEPELEPGTYLVGYRARGRRAASPAEKSPPIEDALALDVDLDWIVFSRIDGTPVRAVRTRIEWVPSREGRAVIVDPESLPRTDAAPSSERLLRFELFLPTRTSKKGLGFALTMRLEPGVTGGVWRRTL